MVDWLSHILSALHLTWRGALLMALLTLLTFVGSLALVSFLLVRLPPTYFQAAHEREFWVDRHPLIRWCGLIAKNLFGLLMVLLGIVMSVPGVPGQGLLTILLGIMFLDFPGKRRLEQRLVSRPTVLRGINRLRAKFKRPPLVLD